MLLFPHQTLKTSLLVLWLLMIRVGDHSGDTHVTDISITLNSSNTNTYPNRRENFIPTKLLVMRITVITVD